jgi:hypothetical protein
MHHDSFVEDKHLSVVSAYTALSWRQGELLHFFSYYMTSIQIYAWSDQAELQ